MTGNDDSRRELYGMLKDDGYYNGNYSEFTANIDKPDGRKELYDMLSEDGYYSGQWEDFDKKLTIDGKTRYSVSLANGDKRYFRTKEEGDAYAKAHYKGQQNTGPSASPTPSVQQKQNEQMRAPYYDEEAFAREREEQIKPFSKYSDEEYQQQLSAERKKGIRGVVGQTPDVLEQTWEQRGKLSELERGESVERKSDVTPFFEQYIEPEFEANKADVEGKAADIENQGWFPNMSREQIVYKYTSDAIAREKITDPKVVIEKTMKNLSPDVTTEKGKAFNDLILKRMGLKDTANDEGKGDEKPMSKEEIEAFNNYYGYEYGKIADEIQSQLYDEYKKAGAPKGTLDYILSNALRSNIIVNIGQSMIEKAAHSSGMRRQMRDMVLNEYSKNAGIMTNAVSGAVNIATDPLMYAIPGVGSTVAKGVTNLAGRTVAKMAIKRAGAVASKEAVGAATRYALANSQALNIASRAIASGVTLGGISAAHAGAEQFRQGQFNGEELLEVFGENALVGAATAGVAGKLESMARFSGRAARIGAATGGYAVNVGGFSAYQMWEKARAQGKDVLDMGIDEWAQTVGENAVMFGIMDLPKMAKAMRERNVEARRMGMELTPDMIRELEDAGYRNLFQDIAFMADKKPSMEILDGEKSATVEIPTDEEHSKKILDELNKLVKNDKLSTETRRRMFWYATGKMLMPDGVYQVSGITPNEDGTYTVDSFNEAGQRIESKRFKNASEAKAWKEQFDVECLQNMTGALESVATAPVRNINTAITDVAEEESMNIEGVTFLLHSLPILEEAKKTTPLNKKGQQMYDNATRLRNKVLAAAKVTSEIEGRELIDDAVRMTKQQTGVDVNTINRTQKKGIFGKGMSKDDMKVLDTYIQNLQDLLNGKTEAKDFASEAKETYEKGYGMESPSDVKLLYTELGKAEESLKNMEGGDNIIATVEDMASMGKTEDEINTEIINRANGDKALIEAARQFYVALEGLKGMSDRINAMVEARMEEERNGISNFVVQPSENASKHSPHHAGITTFAGRMVYVTGADKVKNPTEVYIIDPDSGHELTVNASLVGKIYEVPPHIGKAMMDGREVYITGITDDGRVTVVSDITKPISNNGVGEPVERDKVSDIMLSPGMVVSGMYNGQKVYVTDLTDDSAVIISADGQKYVVGSGEVGGINAISMDELLQLKGVEYRDELESEVDFYARHHENTQREIVPATFAKGEKDEDEGAVNAEEASVISRMGTVYYSEDGKRLYGVLYADNGQGVVVGELTNEENKIKAKPGTLRTLTPEQLYTEQDAYYQRQDEKKAKAAAEEEEKTEPNTAPEVKTGDFKPEEDTSGTVAGGEVKGEEVNGKDISMEGVEKPFTEKEANDTLLLMEQQAENDPQIELSSEAWISTFGINNSLTTPIGVVKMGENQYNKLVEKKRDAEFGMVVKTLQNPDLVLIEPSEAREGQVTERPYSYLFVKTFKKNGKAVKFYTSVTVLKDSMEISVSSHYSNKSKVVDRLKSLGRIYTKETLLSNSSEMRLAENPKGLPDLLPSQDSNASYSGKVTSSSENVQGIGNETTVEGEEKPQNEGVSTENVKSTEQYPSSSPIADVLGMADKGGKIMESKADMNKNEPKNIDERICIQSSLDVGSSFVFGKKGSALSKFVIDERMIKDENGNERVNTYVPLRRVNGKVVSAPVITVFSNKNHSQFGRKDGMAIFFWRNLTPNEIRTIQDYLWNTEEYDIKEIVRHVDNVMHKEDSIQENFESNGSNTVEGEEKPQNEGVSTENVKPTEQAPSSSPIADALGMNNKKKENKNSLANRAARLEPDEMGRWEDYVLVTVGSGVKFKTKDSVGSKGIVSHTTGNVKDIPLVMLDNTNGETPEVVAHRIYEGMPERMKESCTDQDVFNEILDIVVTYPSYNAMLDEAEARVKGDAEAMDAAIEEEQKDQYAQAQGFRDYAELTAHERTKRLAREQMDKSVAKMNEEQLRQLYSDWVARVNYAQQSYERNKTPKNYRQWELDYERYKAVKTALDKIATYDNDMEGFFDSPDSGNKDVKGQKSKAVYVRYDAKIDSNGKEVYTKTDIDGKTVPASRMEYLKARKANPNIATTKEELKAMKDEYAITALRKSYPSITDVESADDAIEAINKQIDEADLNEEQIKVLKNQIADINKMKRIFGADETDSLIEDPDMQISDFSEKDQERIREASKWMTKKDAKRMLEMAYNIQKPYFDEPISFDNWVKQTPTSDITMIVDNEYAIQDTFLNPIYEKNNRFGNDFWTDHLVDAYKLNLLDDGGTKKTQSQRVDLGKAVKVSDSRFYAPKQIELAENTLEIAKQRVTKSNKAEVLEARQKIVLFAHNEGAAETIGMSKAEFNRMLRSWTRESASIREVSQKINKGIEESNRWSGIENMAATNAYTISDEEIERMTGGVEGDSNGMMRKDIARTMLAIDTHTDWSGIKIKFAGTKEFEEDFGKLKDPKKVSGFYRKEDRLVEVRLGRTGHTTPHEMGHALDHTWGLELGFNGYLTHSKSNKLSGDAKLFVDHVNEFITDLIKTNADIRNDYTTDRTEVFARFVDYFVNFTESVANNTPMSRNQYFEDKFTAGNVVEFAKILQEKSVLDSQKGKNQKNKTLIDKQQTNLADVEYLDLNSIANIIDSFENPVMPEEENTVSPVLIGQNPNNTPDLLSEDGNNVSYMIELTDAGNREVWEHGKINIPDKVVLVKNGNGAVVYGADARKVAKELGIEKDGDSIVLNGGDIAMLEKTMGNDIRLISYEDAEGNSYLDANVGKDAILDDYTNKNAARAITFNPEYEMYRTEIGKAFDAFSNDGNDLNKQALIDAAEDYAEALQAVVDKDIDRRVTDGAAKVFAKEVAKTEAYIDGILDGKIVAPEFGGLIKQSVDVKMVEAETEKVEKETEEDYFTDKTMPLGKLFIPLRRSEVAHITEQVYYMPDNKGKGWDGVEPNAIVMTSNLRARYPELHNAAKNGDVLAARTLIEEIFGIKRDGKFFAGMKLGTPAGMKLYKLMKDHPNATVVYPHREEGARSNVLGQVYAQFLEDYGFAVDDGIVMINRPGHTDASKDERLLKRSRYEGSVQEGGEYIIIDDHITMGGTVRDMKDFIEWQGGKVVAVSTLTKSMGSSASLVPTKEQINKLIELGVTDEQLKEIGISSGLTNLTKGEAERIQVLSQSGRNKRNARANEGGKGKSEGVNARSSRSGRVGGKSKSRNEGRITTPSQETLTPPEDIFATDATSDGTDILSYVKSKFGGKATVQDGVKEKSDVDTSDANTVPELKLTPEPVDNTDLVAYAKNAVKVRNSQPKKRTYKNGKGKTIKYQQLSFLDDINPKNEETKSALKVSRPTPLDFKLKPLRPGDLCYAERKYTEDGNFVFTGRDKIESADDIAYLFRMLEDKAIENSFLVIIDKNDNPTIIHAGMGAANQTIFDSESISLAMQNIDASLIYMIHNHPSGRLQPSNEDRNTLRKLRNRYGAKVQDGIIIDTFSGQYAEFNESYNDVKQRPEQVENEKEYKVYNFDKQVFSKDYDPASNRVSTKSEVAAFLSSHRLGNHAKTNILVANNNGIVTGNFALPFNLDPYDVETQARYIANIVSSVNGRALFVYGSGIDFEAVNKIRNLLKTSSPLILLDAFNINGRVDGEDDLISADENGLLSESNKPIYNQEHIAMEEDAINMMLGEPDDEDTDPHPDFPQPEEGELLTDESFRAKMDKYHKDVRAWKERKRAKEEKSAEDAIFSGDTVGAPTTGVGALDTPEKAEEELFADMMYGEKKDVTQRQMKSEVREQIRERRRTIETCNFEDAIFVHDIKKVTTPEERKRIPFILEGTDAEPVSNELKATVDKIRTWFDEMHQFMSEEGLFRQKERQQYVTNYVTHIWDKENVDPDKLAHLDNWISKNSPYTRDRIIPTLQAGLDMGLKMKYEDITDIILDYGHRATEAIANRRLINFLKGYRVDGFRLLIPHEEYDADYDEIGNNALKDYLVYKPMIPQLEVVFGKLHWSKDPKFQKLGHFWDVTTGVMKKMNLSWSFFHHGALTETAISMMGPKEFSRVLGKKMLWDVAFNGGELPAFLDKDAARDAVKHFVVLGATQDYAAKDVQNITGKLRKLLEDKDIKGLKEAAIIADAINIGMDTLLWDWLHDGYKIYAFKKMADEIRSEAIKGKDENGWTVYNDGWNLLKLNMCLDEAGQLVNDTFGGQHWDLLNISPGKVKLLRRCLMSGDWTFSTMRQAVAPFGVGALYDDMTFWEKFMDKLGKNITQFGDEMLNRFDDNNDFKYKGGEYKQNSNSNDKEEDNYDLWEDAKKEAIRTRKKYARHFWTMAFIFMIPFWDSWNAAMRMKDVNDEKKKAEEIRKEDPHYLSPYELAYPDGMKWWDYTLVGNTYGQRTHIFLGRDSNGNEIYGREGKQYREAIELIYGRDGFDFPDPLVSKVVGKLNPGINAAWTFLTGKSLLGYESPFMKNKTGWERKVGMLQVLAASYLPYTIPTDDEKEFTWESLVMPTSKGFSAYKAKKYFETAILTGDMDMVEQVYKACAMNNINADQVFEATCSMIEATARKSMLEGVESIGDACAMYDNERDPKKRSQLRNYIKKMSSAQNFKQIEKGELIQKAYDVIEGTDVSTNEEKVYDALSSSNDVVQDWRLSKAITGLKPYDDEYREKFEDNREVGKIFYEGNKRKISKYRSLLGVRNQINKIKRTLGKEPVTLNDGTVLNDTERMKMIRDLRKKALEEE